MILEKDVPEMCASRITYINVDSTSAVPTPLSGIDGSVVHRDEAALMPLLPDSPIRR
jgi:hypothetical protein